MSNFQKLIQKQINNYESQGSNSDIRKPKNGNWLTFNNSIKEFQNKYNTSTVFYRIIPYESDHFFATPVKQTSLSIPKRDGSLMLVLFYAPQPESGIIPKQWNWTEDNPAVKSNNIALDLITQIISFNREYRGSHPEIGKADKIPLKIAQTGGSTYPATLQKRYYVSAMRGIFNQQHKEVQFEYTRDNIKQTKIPDIKTVQLPETAYIPILQRLERGMDLAPNNKPFPTELGFIDKTYAVPLAFSRNGMQYTLEVEIQYTKEEPLPDNYLVRSTDNVDYDYVMFDNPAYYIRPTQGDFLEKVIIPFLERKVKDIKNLSEPAGNKYVTGMNSQPFVASPQRSAVQNQQPTQVQSQPQSQPVAQSPDQNQQPTQVQSQPVAQPTTSNTVDPFADNVIEGVPDNVDLNSFLDGEDGSTFMAQEPQSQPVAQSPDQNQQVTQPQSQQSAPQAQSVTSAQPDITNSNQESPQEIARKAMEDLKNQNN